LFNIQFDKEINKKFAKGKTKDQVAETVGAGVEWTRAIINLLYAD
jgi:hypothetical protein